jgi:hypothetical protein
MQLLIWTRRNSADALLWRIVNDDETVRMQAFFGKIVGYAPHFKGPVSPEIGAKSIMKVIHAASLEKGDGGKHVSYWGSTSRCL